MSRSHIVSSSSSAILIDAKLEEHQLRGSKHCPSCGHKLESKPDWFGLPAGVKFDPTDQELIEHLEAKVSVQGLIRSHPLIDEFIPTIEGEDGICYTHPEKLPGVTRDGLSKHFFHRPSKAYTTGTRKRRKIQTETDIRRGETRWHKTGKTRAVMANGRQKGCKKILVLYTNFGKHRKPEKTNWVMHQYHLGEMEEEKEGELVVSKIFYQTQPRQCGTVGAGETIGILNCSSSKQAVDGAGVVGVYGGVEQLQKEEMSRDVEFSFDPFRKGFDEVGLGEKASNCLSEASISREEGAFHINRSTNSISAIISPASTIQHASMILEDPYHVSRLLFQSDKFQQQQQKLVERPAGAGLEEMIMACTSTNIKPETSLPHPQEPEWLKYSYWSPDSHDHHE
ncbi:uncharacterized protein LOC110029961 isoform X2 [Phalaenopsis equestris]|uniref:uncharacterized protein LOC110029961 isoform X2 n=1 Tax=Phalaenopsis equestris TaxID=78828 RepID=UPI0009E366D4|nr:uncharacterized protein LOC110029961 isoform X2 [Phalaenopsis equestris]